MSIEPLIEEQFTDNYLGMEPIKITCNIGSDTEILKAYLGANTHGLYFGKILTVIRHESKFFVLIYHVWQAGQRPVDANRLSEIQELCVKKIAGMEVLSRNYTNFGLQAFWRYTPDQALNSDARAIRAISNTLKQYSVSHQLCANFRRASKSQPAARI